MKPIKLLWMSDTPTAFTGFATVTRELLGRLAVLGNYQVACVGWGYDGWPYDRQAFPYDIYPASMAQFGRDTLARAIQEFQPDIFICLGDLWMIEWIAGIPNQEQFKSLIYFPIDGEPLHPWWRTFLRQVDLPITYSHYAQGLVERTFPEIRTKMIYHGVDTDVFRPLDKVALKQTLHLQDKFVVGCVSRNQPRKHLPILIKAFARFCEDKEDALLYLHTNPEDVGWDIIDLLQRYNLMSRTCISKHASVSAGVAKEKLNEFYNLFDVMALPSSGEGFGLPLLEAMAAGVPVITTDYSAGAELVKGRGELIQVKTFLTTGRYNVEMVIPDTDDLVAKLNLLYEDADLRQTYRERGLAFARTLSWEHIVSAWDELLVKVYQEKVA